MDIIFFWTIIDINLKNWYITYFVSKKKSRGHDIQSITRQATTLPKKEQTDVVVK